MTSDTSASEPPAPNSPNESFRRELEEALNPPQLAAVSATEGAHLVIAGAGSGKTRTLVYRVAALVQSGVRPESILLLTFTRRASQEMLRRAAGLLDERCRRVSGGTFHSFANLALRRYADRLGFGDRFTIMDRSDAVDLMGILRTEAGQDRKGRRFPRADAIVNLLSKQVNTSRPLRDLLEEQMPQFVDELDPLLELQGLFKKRKKEQNVMDYDDLLVHLRDLLVQHGEVRQKLASRYRYIMVDEYQDTNRLQAHITALLASVHGNIMVVGDDAQSIYSFRGANFRNIIDFPQIFPGTQQILLEQNYRSVQPILDLGNAVLSKAKEKFAKKLYCHLEGDQKPVFVRTPDDHAQAEFICRQILHLREEGVPLGDMAILARAAWHSNSLEVELQNRNIPFRKFGGIRFVEAAHIKDVSALLKLAANPFDTGAWFRILQLFEGIGPKTARNITGHVLDRGGDPRVLVQPKLTSKKYGKPLEQLSELLLEIAKPQLDLTAKLERAIETYRPWMKSKYDDAARRMRDFEALSVLAERHQELDSFLSELAIDPPDFQHGGGGSDDTEDEWVTISTVHSSKGLEWHSVFILQLNAGRFPNFASLNDEQSFEEERRLLYVAVTRAKQNLFLMKPEEINTHAYSYEVGEISPLLAEIDNFDQLVEARSFARDVASPQAAEGLEDRDDQEQLKRIQDYFSDPT